MPEIDYEFSSKHSRVLDQTERREVRAEKANATKSAWQKGSIQLCFENLSTFTLEKSPYQSKYLQDD